MTPTKRYAAMSPCARSVVDAIAHVYGVHPTALLNCARRSRAAFARAVAIYVCRAELDMGWMELQKEFGISSPGAIYAVERVAKAALACDVKTLAGVCAGERVAESFNGGQVAAE